MQLVNVDREHVLSSVERPNRAADALSLRQHPTAIHTELAEQHHSRSLTLAKAELGLRISEISLFAVALVTTFAMRIAFVHRPSQALARATLGVGIGLGVLWVGTAIADIAVHFKRKKAQRLRREEVGRKYEALQQQRVPMQPITHALFQAVANQQPRVNIFFAQQPA